MIEFENIYTKETMGIDRQTGGQYYRAKLSALINSSNMGINADRGQDFGYRLIPEQQALIELWESDPEMIDKVSQFTKVMIDDLTHSEFLAYLLHQQELGKSPEQNQKSEHRAAQTDYQLRVEEIRNQMKPEAVPAFKAPTVEEQPPADNEHVAEGAEQFKDEAPVVTNPVVQAPKSKASKTKK